MYRLYVPNGGYVCKGSYVFRGDKYKILGEAENAKTYKTEASAQKDLEKLMGTHINIDHKTQIIFNKEE